MKLLPKKVQTSMIAAIGREPLDILKEENAR
jgi:hypothetical protein